MKNELINELSQNFIEYAVACNSDRAIPDATTGLKPVAQRILYGAFDKGYISSKPHVKCAKVVGEVMGTYHPHGDSSIYGALVRLAEDWTMRYPLIDFHGNLGNIGGDGPAAMRYTEARLSKLVEDGMLFGLKKDAVDFKPNYDETTTEPVTLPSIFPNLLCNPNSGIGVAIACSWLPHNLKEVSKAIFDYMDGLEPTLEGPDFPTGGLIINKNDIPRILKTGHGSVKVRGKYKIEKQNIIFYEIPYGVSTENLLKEIGEASDKGNIVGISDIRDESNKKGLRIVIECQKEQNPENIVMKLFAETDLQTSISYNQIALVNKVPTELNLEDCIKIYIKHNIECIVKEYNYDLNKAKDRKEIVDGLLKALEDIDNIISLIKSSDSVANAKVNLISKYKFTEAQAKAIVDMKLGKLAGLEKIELQNEAKELNTTIEKILSILNSHAEQEKELKSRLSDLVSKYGDARRTEIAQIEVSKEEKEIEQVVPEDCVVIMNQNGDIKRVATSSFKVQRRNTKGAKTADDAILATISTNTIDTLMFFTDKGKMFRLLVDDVPAGTNATRGTNVRNFIKIEDEEKVIAVTSLKRKADFKYAIFLTKQGLFKKTLLEEYISTKRSSGIAAIKLKDGDSIANVVFANDEDFVIVTKKGLGIHFETMPIAPIGRVTSGVKSIKLGNDDEVLCGFPIQDSTNIGIFTSNGYTKKVSVNEIPLQGRAGKGVILSSVEIASAFPILDEDNVLIVGSPNSVCISAKDIPILGRAAMGNIAIKGSSIKEAVKL